MRLFLRSRHTAPWVVIAVALGALLAIAGRQELTLGTYGTFQVVVAQAIPLVLATTTGLLLVSPAPVLERSADRRLQTIQLLHLVAQSTTGAAVLAMGGVLAGSTDVAVEAARSFIGLSGVALISAAITGLVGGWVGPLLWVTAPPFVLAVPEDDPTGGLFTFWALSSDSTSATIYAIALWLLGLACSFLRR